MKYPKNSNKKNPKVGGPESAFLPDFPERAYRLALLGLTDKQIAHALGIQLCTLDKYKKNRADFREALQAGKIEADAHVAEALYKRAIGYSHPDVHILANRVDEYDEAGNKIRSYVKPLIVNITKHYPPDGFSATKWLGTRQREKWSDVQKVEHTITNSVGLLSLAQELKNTAIYSDQELEMALRIGLKRQVEKAMQSTSN